MLSLIENMTKHIIVMRDSFYNECLVFLNQCECKLNTIYYIIHYIQELTERPDQLKIKKFDKCVKIIWIVNNLRFIYI